MSNNDSTLSKVRSLGSLSSHTTQTFTRSEKKQNRKGLILIKGRKLWQFFDLYHADFDISGPPPLTQKPLPQEKTQTFFHIKDFFFKSMILCKNHHKQNVANFFNKILTFRSPRKLLSFPVKILLISNFQSSGQLLQALSYNCARSLRIQLTLS